MPQAQSKNNKELLSNIDLQQLEVLLQSDCVQFNRIKQQEISSPQQLLIYFHQQSNSQYQNSQHLLNICKRLLNDQFASRHHFQQHNKIPNQNNLSTTVSNQNTQQLKSQHQNFQTNQQVYCQESILLTHQTLSKIEGYFPFSIGFIKTQNIPKFSLSHCLKLLTLIDIEIDPNQIQTHKLLLKSPEKLVFIIEDIILPIIFLHGTTNNGDTLINCVIQMKNIMNILNNYHDSQSSKNEQTTQVTQILSQAVTNFYLKKCQQNPNLQIHPIIAMMTSIQAIHSASQKYHPALINSKHFISHINLMLRCSNVDSKTANSIAVNIYGNLLKQKDLYCSQAQIFINLYTTLRCFGAHLIKDVWRVFYDFIQIESNDIILSKAELIDIIFYKIQHHQNANVVKHCIQSILQQERSYILFEKVPDAIYNSLMRILNYGMHYLDCLFHMDSKMFAMISSFFAGYFNNPSICKDSDIEKHMKKFLKAISQKISFDHALVSLLHSFTLIIRKSHTIDQQTLQLITKIIRKYYVKNPIRKRHQLMKGVTFLLKNHLLTEQKMKQLSLQNNPQTNKDQKSVSLSCLVENCLCYFPEQYLTLTYNQQSKKDQIYAIIEENFSNQEFNQTIKTTTQSIINQLKDSAKFDAQSSKNIMKNLQSIQLILYLSQQETSNPNQIRCTFQSFSGQVVELLTQMYCLINEKIVQDLGESMYKSKSERIFGILVQQQCFKNIFGLKIFNPLLSSFEFVEKSLTNVSYFIKEIIQQGLNMIQDEQLRACQNVVSRNFQMIYRQGNDNKELQERLSKVGSQFLEWASDNLQTKPCQLLILSVLKCRIKLQQNCDIDYIEESVYKIFWAIFQLQYKNKNTQRIQTNKNEFQINQSFVDKINNINPLLRLRLFTLSANILFNDSYEVQKFIPKILSNIDQIADRYDFENLDEVFNLIQNFFTCPQSLLVQKQAYQKVYNNKTQQTFKNISTVIWSVIQNMLASLNYGVDTKEVITCTDCVLNILFHFAEKYQAFNTQLVKLTIKVLSIGEEYWMFERVMSFKVIQKLQRTLHKHKNIDFRNLFPLLSRILCIQEYRGYDSAIALQPYLSQKQFYTQLKLILNPDADYEGITCRLALVSFINSLNERSLNSRQNLHRNLQVDRFLLQFFIHLFGQVRKDQGQKMFMTGEHKVKIKHWQCIMAYDIQWLYLSLIKGSKQLSEKSQLSLSELVFSLINMVDLNNNLAEVKYYIELFLMKSLVNKNSLEIITSEILNCLSEKLLELISQVNKNLSFIVIGGMLINYLFKTYQISKQHPFYQNLQKLYNALLTYSCSHVAYFRGLSQYFCLETLFIESPYTRILHKTIGQDPDTIILRDKLNIIMNQYFKEIHTWTVTNNLLKQLPTLNRNIVSDTFYLDRIKRLGQQLLRQIKGQLGFLPYKDIWIEAVKTLNLTSNSDDVNLQAKQQNPQQAIFQRKIDPSLDFIYFSKTKLQGFQMKIIITGAKAIPIYGHLSRTGQIFGLSQLILPYKEIIQDQQFKNVACTAQKWLNISEFSNQTEIKNKEKFFLSLQKKLIQIKEQGYSFFLLKKNDRLNKQHLDEQLSKIKRHKKILLILDFEDYLPLTINCLLEGVICFGRHFSEHVEASIFIWEYFKEVYNKKFRVQ